MIEEVINKIAARLKEFALSTQTLRLGDIQGIVFDEARKHYPKSDLPELLGVSIRTVRNWGYVLDAGKTPTHHKIHGQLKIMRPKKIPKIELSPMGKRYPDK